MNRVVELYAQDTYHSGAALRISKDAAADLAKLLGRFAESSDTHVSADFFASDGEGYILHIIDASLKEEIGGTHYIGHDWQAPDCGENIVHKVVEGRDA